MKRIIAFGAKQALREFDRFLEFIKFQRKFLDQKVEVKFRWNFGQPAEIYCVFLLRVRFIRWNASFQRISSFPAEFPRTERP